MNILLIGNGFDLAHGLPTKYTDFLFFCHAVKRVVEDSKIEDKIPKDDENYFNWLNNDKKVFVPNIKIDTSCYISSFILYLEDMIWN